MLLKQWKLFLISYLVPIVVSGCQSQISIKTLTNISYYNYQINQEKKSLLLDLYLPEKKSQNPLPIIIFIHGGGWYEGDKNICPGEMIAQSGYAMACISYRFSSEALFPAQIYDVKQAVRWLRKNAHQYNLNPNKIGAWGYSAGGHLSLLLGTSSGVVELEGKPSEISSKIQAVVNWYGPTDFSQVPPAFEAEITPELLKESRKKPWYLYILATHRLLGSPVSQQPELTQMANPIHYIDPSDPPVFIMHGELDKVVPISQSEILYQALKENGVPVTFFRPTNRGHSFTGKNREIYDPKLIKMTLNFFDQHLQSN